jgi:hypothetical protein
MQSNSRGGEVAMNGTETKYCMGCRHYTLSLHFCNLKSVKKRAFDLCDAHISRNNNGGRNEGVFC